MTTVTIQVPKEGASVELMLIGDTPAGEVTLILPDGVVLLFDRHRSSGSFQMALPLKLIDSAGALFLRRGPRSLDIR